MTLSTTESNQGFVGDGVITVFAVTYKVLDESHLEVYIDNVLQVGGYTVTLNPDQETTPGADVTFDVAPADLLSVTVLRVVPLTQETDYQPYDAFPADSHETALDKLTMQTQQNAEAISRGVQLPVDTPLDGYDVGTPEGNMVVQYRADETGQESSGIDATSFNQNVQDAADSAAAAAASEAKAQEWAENPEDDPVETSPDQFSALHWAQKALLANQWDQYLAGFELGGLHTEGLGDIDTVAFNSKYYVNTANITNGPAAFTGLGILETDQWAADTDQAVQLLTSMDNANKGKAWIRNREGGAWGAWKAFGAGGVPNTQIHTALDFTMEAGGSYLAAAGLGITSILLPAVPELGESIHLADLAQSWDGTIILGGNGNTIEGEATVPLQVAGSSLTLTWDSGAWRLQGMVNGTYRGTVAPALPKVVNRWWDTESGRSYVHFDDGSSFQWVEENPAAPSAASELDSVMVGAVQDFPGLQPNAKWLYCDGQEVSRTGYPLLFAYIGETYGVGDGANTFNLPDYRGNFRRSMDDGAGVDPDAASRTDRGDGSDGDVVGSKQGFALQNITGALTGAGGNRGVFNGASGAYVLGNSETGWANTGNSGNQESGHTFDASRVAATSTETRPVNINVRTYIYGA